ncbi:MAG: TRAP transporter small permease subunit [Victivallales bacterium]|jgi:TRAP-type C4-dicarboxylate transport system permease small subunit
MPSENAHGGPLISENPNPPDKPGSLPSGGDSGRIAAQNSEDRDPAAYGWVDGPVGRTVRRVEEITFSVFLVLMIVLGLLPIILRYFSSVGVQGTDVLSRHLLLWIALLGAGTAVRERSSISVDLLSQMVSMRKRLILRGITEFASVAVCVIVVWVSIIFVRSQAEFSNGKLAILSIPEWWLSLVLPIGFSILTLRLFVAAVTDLAAAWKMKRKSDCAEGG